MHTATAKEKNQVQRLLQRTRAGHAARERVESQPCRKMQESPGTAHSPLEALAVGSDGPCAHQGVGAFEHPALLVHRHEFPSDLFGQCMASSQRKESICWMVRCGFFQDGSLVLHDS